MTWRVPLIILILMLLGWAAILEPVIPDADDLESRRTMPVYGVGE